MLDGGEEETIKVIIVGDGFSGKTSLLRRFVRGDFTDQYRKTIGAEFLEKDVFLRDFNSTVKLMLWDTAGQEVFNALTQAYYRGAGAAVLVFSTVDRESFVNVASWKQRVEAVCGAITMVLCQTKFDLSHEAAITNDEAEELAKLFRIPFYRVSSKDDFNVTQLFEFTAQQCLTAAAAAENAAAPPDVPLREEPSTRPPPAVAATTPPLAQTAASGATGPSRPGTAAASQAAKEESARPGGAEAAHASTSSPPGAVQPAPASASATAAASGPAAHGKKQEGNPRKVRLTEQDAAAAERGKKKKKKRCTLL